VRRGGGGTKGARQCGHVGPAGGCVTLRLRLTDRPTPAPLTAVDAIIAERRAEADAFYDRLAPAGATADERLVQRRALAGLLWSKESYLFDVARWVDRGDPAPPPPAARPQRPHTHRRPPHPMAARALADHWGYPSRR